MAIYHHKVKIISRSAGPSLIASAAYRAGKKIRDEKAEKTFDYRRRQGVLHSEIIAPIRSPDWVYERSSLWNTVEATEKRKDSQLAREILVALPTELGPDQRIKLVRGYIFEQFIKKGMIADFVIHAPSKKGDDRNFHAHILLTMRTITSEGFGGKAREWNAKANIYQWRQAWEKHTNKALEQAGFDCRVDCRSHADKGSNLEPQLHLGYQAMAIERKGQQSERGNENRAIQTRNAMKTFARKEPVVMDDFEQHDDLEQANPHQNEILDPEDKSSDLHQKYLLPEELVLVSFSDVQKNQTLSWEHLQATLEQKKAAFEERENALYQQIENVTDEKSRDRFNLQKQLENSIFTKCYNEMRVTLLKRFNSKEHANEIASSQFKARKAGKEYQQLASEWNSRSVRDGNYLPTDQKIAEKINTIKETERTKWANLAIKAEKNHWDQSRIEKERQRLVEELDYQLALNFSLERNLSLSR